MPNVRTGAGGDLPDLLGRWRADLAAWAIPEQITAAVADSPWVLPRQVFARRADRVSAAPSGPSFDRAWAALDPPGSVLDVGSGAGAACLPLLPRVTSLTAVDADADMLEQLSQRAAAAGVVARTVLGRWPETAALAGPADVVTCHNVLYNVAEVAPFVTALTGSARRMVVAEMTAQHPLVSLNDLWLKFHGLRRPVSPTAADVIEILAAMGLRPEHQAWRRPSGRDYAGFDELVDVTRRRLCLPPGRAPEVAEALTRSGVDPEHPVDLGTSGREVVTICWDGTAG
jgi:SAM-dependent methyltransferase